MAATVTSRLSVAILITLTALGCAKSRPPSAADTSPRRNVILFIADGLRPGAVNASNAPTLLMIRNQGVNFTNSHAVFPTLTMPNGAAMATGHYPGDSGQFGNVLFTGRQAFASRNFGRTPGTLTPNLEEDHMLGDVAEMFAGNYLTEESLLAAARINGYNTAALGKIGPTAMQDVSQLAPVQGVFRTPSTVIMDGSTGTAAGVPVDPEIVRLLELAGLGAGPPARSQSGGTNETPGSLAPNVAHYGWLADAATRVILPRFVANGKPFALVFWSGDPDQTQHVHGDSLNSLTPGINGPTSRAAVRNADDLLRQLLDYVAQDPTLRDNTNIFVTSDHGFSTVSRRAVNRAGDATRSYSATFTYRDAEGRQEVNTGYLPAGHLAIDLAHALNLPIFAPDLQLTDANGMRVFARIDPTLPKASATGRQRPVAGSLIGGTGRVDRSDAQIVVAGYSLYVPGRDANLVRSIVASLATLDYVGALFVHDSYGRMPGALPMSSIGMVGATPLPSPAVIVGLREFALDPGNPSMTSVVVEGGLQQGQGTHGAFARANSFINMAAMGPDFKRGFVDEAPAGNVDIAPTLARIMRIPMPSGGRLRGRVLSEALVDGPRNVASQRRTLRSDAASSGKATTLHYQQVGEQRYYDLACFAQNDCR